MTGDLDSSRRAEQLRAKLKDTEVYAEAVAEVCDEDIFQKIEAEYNLRIEVRNDD